MQNGSNMRKRFKVVERGAAFILQLTLLQAPAASGSERSSTISPDKAKPSETSSLDHATNLKQDAKTFAMEWKSSLPVDERDRGIGIIGGTEARSLVGMDGKLYAGIGYWR